MALAVGHLRTKFGYYLSVLPKVAASRTFYTYAREPGMVIKGKDPRFIAAEHAQCAFECLQSGHTVLAQGAAATPTFLLEAMTEYAKSRCLKDIKVLHMHTEGKAPYTDPACEGIFKSISVFMGGNVRKAVAEGRADCIPIFLHEIPKLFVRKIIKPDIAVVSLSPPDHHGFCSIGTSVDCIRMGLKYSNIIIGQINKCLPRTFGDSHIHISHIDYAVCVDSPLPQHGGKPPNKIETKIGQIIADNLVENGATLQLGIGSIPDAVLASLKGHKDLGVHSEMFADGVVDLVYEGCITNGKKTMHQGRTVGSFLNGTQKLYDWVDNNPSVEMLRVEYVNDPEIIARQPNMTAINSAIEIDITGQVCADSIGTRMYSGFGGQVDFIRGAGAAHDGKGKPIVALPSVTTKNVSKIAPTIKLGAGVVTTRAHVNYVVTEYGVASLFGKTLKQRAHALICIAHPDHRQALEKAAFERYKVMPSAD